jgi:hypothetical protein
MNHINNHTLCGHFCGYMVLVGRAVVGGWEAEQCRPEAWAVRGTASMPEAPLGRGGIATNVVANIFSVR